MIRTSGEYRISNFLLWEIAYSELVFTDVLWPDFRREHLFDAVREYQDRERRFGGVDRVVGRAEVLYRDQGIVLRTYKLGEADRIVVLCTQRPRQGPGRRQGRAQDQEQVRVAPRADEPHRRCSSTRDASSTSSPRPSRSTTSGPSATTSTASPGRRRCSRRSTRCRRRARSTRGSTRCCSAALRALDADNSPLVVPAFFWKLLSLEGYHPILDRCAECGSDGPARGVRPRVRGPAVRQRPAGHPDHPGGGRPAAAHPRRSARRRAAASPSRRPRTRSTTWPPGRSSTTSSAG